MRYQAALLPAYRDGSWDVAVAPSRRNPADPARGSAPGAAHPTHRLVTGFFSSLLEGRRLPQSRPVALAAVRSDDRIHP